MLRLEVFQVLLVGFKVRGLLVLCQLGIVLLLCAVGLSFAAFTFLSRQNLPFLANHLGDFGKRKILPL